MTLAGLALGLSLGIGAVEVDTRPRMLILDMKPAAGTDPEQARVVQSMLTARLAAIGQHQILSSADLAAMIGVEEQQQLVGCTDNSCMAEIGGALGARYILTSGLSRLGDSPVLSLTLIDTEAAKVAGNVSRTLPPDANVWPEPIREAAYEILGLPVPPPEAPPWYKRPWVWAIAGGVALAGGVGAYYLTRDEEASAPLGVVVLDP